MTGVPYVQPTVTVGALFDQAAGHVTHGRHFTADVLLEVVADHASHVRPLLTQYQQIARRLGAMLDSDDPVTPAGVKALDDEADRLRTLIYDQLVRGPDAAPTTGEEKFE